MSRENESLDWKHQGLDPQEQGMHEPDGIHPCRTKRFVVLMSGEEARSSWLLL